MGQICQKKDLNLKKLFKDHYKFYSMIKWSHRFTDVYLIDQYTNAITDLMMLSESIDFLKIKNKIDLNQHLILKDVLYEFSDDTIKLIKKNIIDLTVYNENY